MSKKTIFLELEEDFDTYYCALSFVYVCTSQQGVLELSVESSKISQVLGIIL